MLPTVPYPQLPQGSAKRQPQKALGCENRCLQLPLRASCCGRSGRKRLARWHLSCLCHEFLHAWGKLSASNPTGCNQKPRAQEKSWQKGGRCVCLPRGGRALLLRVGSRPEQPGSAGHGEDPHRVFCRDGIAAACNATLLICRPVKYCRVSEVRSNCGSGERLPK